MFDANVKLIRELKEFVSIVSSDSGLLSHFRYSPNDFVRSRKLPFEKLVLLITKLCKKTLSVEIENFFTESGQGQGQRICTAADKAKAIILFFLE
jgi:hypothetical protein